MNSKYNEISINKEVNSIMYSKKSATNVQTRVIKENNMNLLCNQNKYHIKRRYLEFNPIYVSRKK